jgi:uncharacterized protein Yka (UPF0111/DUF47 family)
MKTEVLSAIGEDELRRPAAVNAALAANDRVKYAFSLLQMAVAHADAPDQPAPTMKRERIACGIDDPALDGFVAAARRQGGRYQLPGVPKLLADIANDMRAMAAPVIDAGKPEVAARLDALLAALPDAADETLDGDAVSAITQAGGTQASGNQPAGTQRSGTRAGGGDARRDSLHHLVMDLHKQLNALQAALAEETIDGAAAYGLGPADRPRVAAFMAGLNRTARLKFDHPGLGTTATRARGRLVIQNDIGTTDAHVIVIHVEALTISVTYTDVHPERLRFFQELLAPRAPGWETGQAGHVGAQLGPQLQFHLATGRFTTDDEASCRACLAFLGSRLVFLIDWNRARKQLRGFLPGAARLALLRWAAENDIGHRGFLALGGARLVYQAIEATAGSAMHFGDRLSDVLGLAEAETFLRFTFRAATEGLLAHQSTTLIRDRIHAELARHFSNEEGRLLRLAADHAGLVFELASLVRDGTLAIGDPDNKADKHARRARRFEHDADRLVIDAREAVRRRPDHAAFAPLLETADDVADALEEAAFLLGLLVHPPKDAVIEPLQALATLLVEAAQEWVKALLHAAHVQDPNAAEDADAFLTAIDRIAVLEHQVDDAERALTRAAIRHARDFAELHVCTELATRLEAASDALLAASLILRDRVLGEVLGA